MPKKSVHLVPKSYRQLIESDDSIISDFYPIDFIQDFNQKCKRSEGIPLIPFVNINRLINATKGLKLNDEEEQRNKILNAYDSNKRNFNKKK